MCRRGRISTGSHLRSTVMKIAAYKTRGPMPRLLRLTAAVFAILVAHCFDQPVRAADTVAFLPTAIRAPECVEDPRGYFCAEDEANPGRPENGVPPPPHVYLVARNMGLDAVAASPSYDYGQLPADYQNATFRDASLTGLTVPEPRSRWQRSSRSDSTADDASAFQLRC
jgi:hypothetical protein